MLLDLSQAHQEVILKTDGVPGQNGQQSYLSHRAQRSYLLFLVS